MCYIVHVYHMLQKLISLFQLKLYKPCDTDFTENEASQGTT